MKGKGGQRQEGGQGHSGMCSICVGRRRAFAKLQWLVVTMKNGDLTGYSLSTSKIDMEFHFISYQVLHLMCTLTVTSMKKYRDSKDE